MIRVGIADDHQVLRDGLKSIIQDSDEKIEVVLEASSSREVLSEIGETPIDVLVVDISMPGMDGLELARRLKREQPNVRTVVLTMYHDLDLIERALQSGVWGYVLKDNAAAMVVEAVVSVHRGETFFDSSIPEETLSQIQLNLKTDSKPTTELTERQLEVLRLICEGKTEREIAKTLGISFHTAHAHKNNIMQKLGLHSKVELLRYAVQRNLLKM